MTSPLISRILRLSVSQVSIYFGRNLPIILVGVVHLHVHLLLLEVLVNIVEQLLQHLQDLGVHFLALRLFNAYDLGLQLFRAFLEFPLQPDNTLVGMEFVFTFSHCIAFHEALHHVAVVYQQIQVFELQLHFESEGFQFADAHGVHFVFSARLSGALNPALSWLSMLGSTYRITSDPLSS